MANKKKATQEVDSTQEVKIFQEVENKENKSKKSIPFDLHKKFSELLLLKLNMKPDRFIRKHKEKFDELEKEVKSYTGKRGNFDKPLKKVFHDGNAYFILKDYPNPVEIEKIAILQQYLKD